jgi:Xaa-Pro dipeptidase
VATAGLVDVRVPLLRETGVGSLLITKQDGAYYLTTNNEAPRPAEEEFTGLGYEPLVQPWYANDIEGSIRKIVGNGKVAADVPAGTTVSISLQPLRFELTASEVLRYRWLGQHTADTATIFLRAL